MRLAWPIWLALGGSMVLGAGCATGGSPDGGRPDTGRLDAPPIDTGSVDVGGNPDDVPAWDVGEPDGGGTDAPLCDDSDSDGFGVGPGCTGLVDCDDDDDTVFPEASELCNGVNDDCDGGTDEGFGMESCGVGACVRMVSTCLDGVLQTCEPGTPATETCNAIDDDCNGTVDDGFGTPTTCGVGACTRSVAMCSGGMPMTCTPGTPGTETCNAVDDDCNGATDDGLGSSTCGVGACRRTTTNCVGGVPQVCSPGAAGTEVCNGQDDDCDGNTDEALGTLSCGFGRCVATAPVCVGGAPGTCVPNGGAARPEMCDSIDDDCNGVADDGIPNLTCGTGACMRSVAACITGVPQTCTPGTPGTEICGNGIDEDCNGSDRICLVNDACGAAIALPGASGTRTDSFDGATKDASDCAVGADIWYSITLGARSILYLDTFGSTFDTHISVRSSCGSAMTACEDDDCSVLQDQLAVDLAAGTYLVAVHAHSTATTTGTVSLRWQTLPTGSGTATRITGNGTYNGTTAGTGVRSSSCRTGTAPENLLYFTRCPAVTSTVTATTCNAATAYDTVLYVNSGTGAEVSCNDDDLACGVSTLRSTTSATTSGPGVYGIFVDGYLAAAGAYSVVVSGL